jgi:hypothetical protein
MAIFRGIGGAGDSTTDATLSAVTEQATNAANSATEAASSASEAASSLASIGSAVSDAEGYANNASSSSSAASASATSAASSATSASSSATAAAASETAAAASESAAATSESNAATSASTATTQASNASTSATAAAASASAAATSASNAATSESNASTSASNASTSATNAATSETNAANSASSASTSATNAAASYDAFDDRYLGSKASDPTLDNDGAALLTGALYYNTTSSVLKVYNGSGWAAINSISNLVDLSDVYTSMSPTDGQLLTWDNANSRWDSADAPVSLPSQTGNSGYFLTTDGTTASWAAVATGDKSADGGFANSVYTAAQVINGGTA